MTTIVSTFGSELAEATAASHNRTFADIPFCWPIDAQALMDPATLPCDNLSALRGDLLLVAREGQAVVGYVHVVVEDAKPEGERDWDDYAQTQGVLRMFWYERGYRAAGAVLLEQAESHVRAHGLQRIEVMHSKRGYPWYHLPHVHLTQRLEHVHALLYAHGFARDKSNVALIWPDAANAPLAPCALDYHLRIEREDCSGPAKRQLLFAEQGDTFCGMCVGASLAEQHADLRARDWSYIRWLTVDEPFRRQGLAQRLLTETFRTMAGEGARHAAICCIEENTPALLLYANMGFRAVDFTYTYVKALHQQSAQVNEPASPLCP